MPPVAAIRSNKLPLFVFSLLFKGHFLLGDDPKCIAAAAVVLYSGLVLASRPIRRPYFEILGLVLESEPFLVRLTHTTMTYKGRK